MRTYILAIATAALFAIPTAAFSEGMYFGFGPGGVRIGPSYGHHRLYNRYDRNAARKSAGPVVDRHEIIAALTLLRIREHEH